MSALEERVGLRIASMASPVRIAAARTAIVFDAACDLPAEYLNQPNVLVLPTAVKMGPHEYVDNHDAARTRAFLAELAKSGGADVETRSYSPEEMRALFLERLALNYDSIYCLTVSAKRSEIHANASRAAVDTLAAARQLREAAGITRPFLLRVIDTKSLFAGQGIAALELFDMVARGLPARDITPRLFEVADSTYGYFVPDDLHYLRTRASQRGDRSVGLVATVLGSMLDVKPVVRAHLGTTAPVAKIRGREEAFRRLFQFARQRVRSGLMTPHVNLSYGGDLADIRDIPAYMELVQECWNAEVTLHESTMSMTGCVNVGPRGLALAFASTAHAPEF